MIEQNTSLRVLDIVAGTSVDGPGLRTSIYFAGCSHHCKDCHNPESWNPHGGRLMTIREIVERIDQEDFNVTFSGGDPLYQIEPLILLAKALKQSGRNIWCYTGYTIEEICFNDRFRPILSYIDVLVDGRFDTTRRDTTLRFRGSSNQRIIDLHQSRIDNSSNLPVEIRILDL